MAQQARYSCEFEGCERTFSRQEHLQRHVLNHAGNDFTCERCRTVFKRPDLLDRHMARHRQKDLEGGKLMTRKRLYKDDHGNVISKRPAKERRSNTTEVSRDTCALPLSPPGSASDPSISPSQIESDQYSAHEPRTNKTRYLGPSLETLQAPLPSLESFFNDCLPWNNTTSSSGDLGGVSGPFDDIFMPDTASSFNMPYTTANNYNWLFDLSFDHLLSEQPSASSDSPMMQRPTSDAQSGRTNPEIPRIATYVPLSNVDGQAIHGTGIHYSTRTQRNETQQYMGTAFETQRFTLEHNPTARNTNAIQGQHRESPMGFMTNNPNLPVLDDISYDRLIDTIERSNPATPNGSLIGLENEILSQSSFQSLLDLFFSGFNTAYPLIHMASFHPPAAEPLLLLSMILLGATYADKDSHQVAVCIHDVLRPQIFSHSSFSAKPELWILQTILLTECLGKSRGGQRQHDMSHLFHGLLINLIRRSDCQSAAPELSIDAKASADQQWKTWIDLEQKKRLAQLCFVWDVQHAVLFSQSLCMSAFELRSTLPCDQWLWEASSADRWRELWQSQTQKSPHLLTVLKAYLKPQNEPMAANQLNALSRVVILHGLMSISWDMTRRDQTSLGMMGNSLSAGSWRDRMSKAYDAWKFDFDVFADSLCDFDRQSELSSNSQDFLIANKAVYHAAQLILNAEILDLQIYAGARHILGRPVLRADYSRSQAAVKSWARRDAARAAKATSHAAQILQDATSSDKDLAIVGNLYHHPWTICLAALTIWSFFHIMPKVTEVEDDEMVWDPRADMKELLETVVSTPPNDLAHQSRQRNCTAGMTAVVSNSLSAVRWGVVHDGMLVLKGLTPWRLINEDRH